MFGCQGSAAVVTVRLIRSFEFRNVKPLVYPGVDGDCRVGEFKHIVDEDIKMRPGLLPPLRKYQYDTMKIFHKAHGAKCRSFTTRSITRTNRCQVQQVNDLVINSEDDNFLPDNQTLRECGIENETEISYFHLEDYQKYKKNPSTKCGAIVPESPL